MMTVSVMRSQRSQRSQAILPSISLTRIGERGRNSNMIRMLLKGEGARSIMAILVATAIVTWMMIMSKIIIIVKVLN
jgi:hypothetical protein